MSASAEREGEETNKKEKKQDCESVGWQGGERSG